MIDLFFEAITTLGDSGFILPASAGLVVALLVFGDRRTAFAFAAGVTTCAVLTIAGKIGFMVFGGFPGRAAIHSPSGHASMATVFFGSLGLIAARAGGAGVGWGCGTLSAAVVVLVALSRVRLHAHTWAEALVGVAIGLASFALVWRFASNRTPIARRLLAIFFIVALAAYAAFGRSFSVEEPLEDIADRIGRMLQP